MLGRCGPEIFRIITLPNMSEILYKMGVLLFSFIYSLIELSYQLFYAVATARIFQEKAFSSFADRIFAVLGILMLFLVTFSLFKMLFDPDALSKGGKGSTKELVTNIFTTIVMLVGVNFAFNLAYAFQKAVLIDNVIPRIFFNSKSSADYNGRTDMERAGTNIASVILETFYLPQDTVDGTGDPEANKLNTIYFYTKQGDKKRAEPTTFKQVYDGIANKGQGSNYLVSSVIQLGDLRCEDYDKVNFQAVLGILVGLFLIYSLFSYAWAMGVRVIQLAFYQLMAPIPIAMRILPGKQEMFSKWLKDVLTTFADVFIRMTIIFFSIYIIEIIKNLKLGQMWENGEVYGGFIAVLASIIVICGVITFIMQAPKMLEDLFGKKGGKGNYGLGLKSLKQNTMPARAAASMVGGAAMGLANNWKASRNGNKPGAARALASALAGATSSARHAAQNVAGGQGMFSAAATATATAAQNKLDRQSRKDLTDKAIAAEAERRGHATPTFGDKVRSRMAQGIGSGARQAQLNSEKEALDAANKAATAATDTYGAQQGYKQTVKDLELASGQLGALKPELDAANDPTATAAAQAGLNAATLAATQSRQQLQNAKDNASFSVGTTAFDQNGNPIAETQTINGVDGPGGAAEYIKTERDKKIAAEEKLLQAKKDQATASADKNQHTQNAQAAQAKINDINQKLSDPALGLSDSQKRDLTDEKTALTQTRDEENSKANAADSTFQNASNIITSATNEIAARSNNIATVEAAVDAQATASGQSSFQVETTTVGSGGGVVKKTETITGVSGASAYISQESAQIATTKSQIEQQDAIQQTAINDRDNCDQEIQSMESEMNSIDSQIATETDSTRLAQLNTDKDELQVKLSDKQTQQAEAETRVQSSQSVIEQLTTEVDLHTENINSVQNASTEFVKSVSGGSTIKVDVPTLDNSGKIVQKVETIVGVDQATKYVEEESTKRSTAESLRSQFQKEHESAVVTRETYVQNVQTLTDQITETNTRLISASSPSEIEQLTKQKEILTTKFIEEKTKLDMTERQVSSTEQNVQNLTTEIDMHTENINAVNHEVENFVQNDATYKTLSQAVSTADQNVASAQEVITRREEVVATHEQLKSKIEGLEKQRQAHIATAYQDNEVTINNQLSAINSKLSKVTDERLIADLRDTYGVDVSKGVSWKDLTEVRTITRIGPDGKDMHEQVTVGDWITKSIEKVEKEQKMIETIRRKKAEKKEEKKG